MLEGTGSYSTRHHALMIKKCIVGYHCNAKDLSHMFPLKFDYRKAVFPIISNARIEHGSIGTIESLLTQGSFEAIARVLPYNRSDRLTKYSATET